MGEKLPKGNFKMAEKFCRGNQKAQIEDQTQCEGKWSIYPNHMSELICHLNIDNFEIFDTHIWTPQKEVWSDARQ